jgi:cytidylate kinase
VSKVPVIAIDGPVGSGKGTISTRLASRLGWHFMDSGALYRLVAIAAIDAGVNMEEQGTLGIEQQEQLTSIAENLDFKFMQEEGQTVVSLSGIDVSDRIRTIEVSAMASRVAAVKTVRGAMIGRQRAFARLPGLVADGRDMGTIIFPEADLKIFLTASVEVRARRRHKQLKDKGESVTLSRLFREIEQRDDRDMSRDIAPLKPAEDAVILDSTEFSIEEVLEKVYQLAKERIVTI